MPHRRLGKLPIAHRRLNKCLILYRRLNSLRTTFLYNKYLRTKVQTPHIQCHQLLDLQTPRIELPSTLIDPQQMIISIINLTDAIEIIQATINLQMGMGGHRVDTVGTQNLHFRRAIIGTRVMTKGWTQTLNMMTQID